MHEHGTNPSKQDRLMGGTHFRRSSSKDGLINRTILSFWKPSHHLKREKTNCPEFNTKFSKAYYRIPISVRPNADFALLYYLKAFDGSFSFLLREKEPQNLDAAFSAAIRIEKNINAAQKVQVPLDRLFDPQARKTQDSQGKALQEPKAEQETNKEEFPSKIVGLLNDLSNKFVKMEKNMQTQQSMHANQRHFQHKKPFQNAKKPEEPKIPVPMSSTNFLGSFF
jgi:hypothetical protein